MSFSSLRLRLLLAAGVFILVATLLSAFGLSLLFKRHVTAWVDAELAAQMEQLIAGIDKSGDGSLAVVRPPGDTRFAQPLSGRYWEVLIEPSGGIYRSRSLWDFEIALPPEATVDDSVRHHSVAGPGGSRLYLIQRRIELPPRLGARTARVAVALDATQLEAAVWGFAGALLPFLLLIAGLLIAASGAQVALGLRPLSLMHDKLAAVASGEAARLGAGLPDEVQPLADEMDALLAAREQAVAKARARAADLAHGLKTPLQVLAADVRRLEAMGESEIADGIAKVSTTMQRHVDREMARARLTASAADRRATADVATSVEGVVRVMRRAPLGERLTWHDNVPAGIRVRIDAADLSEALGNLVENAARHAASRVAVLARAQAGRVAIHVIDDGPGIPLDKRIEATERGRRLDTSAHDGAGLGLAIVSDIAETWGGSLEMTDATAADADASGFCVTLNLPAAPVPASA
jgi:signal transduction histidine kinase